jgi:EAL domain-containing protein (putative c-di-GMP-specific phosphodiesterase class I)
MMSRNVISVEALLRWPHPEHGYISPETIINMAEHTGQIGRLTEWVLDTSLSECRACKLSNNHISIAINLSAWNLQDPELPDMIRAKLEDYGVPPESLTLEITESAMMTDPVRAREVLIALDEMGVSLSIDDFGTGFSSLGYLKMLPVNDLKIDRSFVIDMLEDENDAIIVHSTIELAHNLGLRVIAEGVENQEAMLKLRQLKCDMAQGYFISRPLPANEFRLWLEEYQPRLAR